MGNYRFRLSDMMPNAWFYKLRDMSKPSRSHHHHSTIKKQLPTTAAKSTTTTSKSPKPSELKQPPNPPRPRKSYYFTRDLNLVPVDADFPDPPRKSAKQRTRRRNPWTSPKRVTSSAVSSGCRCRIDSVWTKSDSPPEFSSSPLDTSPEKNSGDEPPAGSFDGMVSNCCGSCRCRVNSVETQIEKLDFDFDSVSDLHHLPPIITKPGFNDMVNDIRKRDEPKKSKSKSNPQNPRSVKIVKEQSIAGGDQKPNIPARKSSPGVRLRTHSPKIGSKKMGRRSVSSTTTSSSSSAARRSISDSCAVVKSSFDPQRDFKESMMEMIVENNLRASKDLEDLLACYLSLNSDEYHELIIGVFKQIWFDLSDLKFK